MNCEERSGFLFAHGCDQAAAWACALCGKNICHAHTRMTERGQACITCARQIHLEQRGQRDQAEDTDDPYFYSYYGDPYYDADDYSAFDDSGQSAAAGDFEGDLSGS